jgi:hypothetical protein
MPQDIGNTEGSCVFPVKVDTLNQLEQNKIGLSTIKQTAIVMLTIQSHSIVTIRCMYYLADCLRQISAGILTLEDDLIYI